MIRWPTSGTWDKCVRLAAHAIARWRCERDIWNVLPYSAYPKFLLFEIKKIKPCGLDVTNIYNNMIGHLRSSFDRVWANSYLIRCIRWRSKNSICLLNIIYILYLYLKLYLMLDMLVYDLLYLRARACADLIMYVHIYNHNTYGMWCDHWCLRLSHVCNWIFLHSTDLTITVSILENDPKYITSDHVV